MEYICIDIFTVINHLFQSSIILIMQTYIDIKEYLVRYILSFGHTLGHVLPIYFNVMGLYWTQGKIRPIYNEGH